jgi:hypothetical protein
LEQDLARQFFDSGRLGHIRIATKSIDVARTSENLGGTAVAKTHPIKRALGTILGIVCIAAATLVPAPAASAANDYGSLTALWWQWIYAQPAIDIDGTNTNPVLDTTGAYAAAGQENGIGPGNKYFFLTGTFGGEVTRDVTVPQGKALFFPILNVNADNAVDPPTDNGVPELKVIAKAPIDAATTLSAEFDGHAVQFFRSTSPTFDYTVPEESIYKYFGLEGSQFEGRIKPAVADGYWAYIPPPSPGSHVLVITGANSTPFSLKVTYNLAVV